MKKFIICLFFIIFWFQGPVMAGSTFPGRDTTQHISLQENRWNAAKVRTSKQSEVRWTARQMERGKSRYDEISKSTGVPWWAIASLHNMECSLNFGQHLHNGDSLTRRTWQVPAGRPKTGKPPFTFFESAVDALIYDKMDKVRWNSLDASLDAFEGYNGWGYRKYHPDTPTPYLWSGTTVYISGKYTQDGKWSSSAISSQIGICAMLKELKIVLKNE